MTVPWSAPIELGPPATAELTACGIEGDGVRTRRPPYNVARQLGEAIDRQEYGII